MTEINWHEVETLIEIRGVYDGWSIAKMKDGSYTNRWPQSDRRFKAAQDLIEMLEDEE